MSLKKHYSEKARLLNDKAVEKIADSQGQYIANNWYGEWETGGAVWFDYSLETGKWMEAYSKLVNGSPANVEIQTVPLTDDTDLNEIEQLINAGLAYYTNNPHLCISISPSALNPDPFSLIASKFDFINIFPLEPENISIATPAKHAIDTGNTANNATDNTGNTASHPTPKTKTTDGDPNSANASKPTNTDNATGTTKPNVTANAGNTTKNTDTTGNTENKTDITPAPKPADNAGTTTPENDKPTVKATDSEPNVTNSTTPKNDTGAPASKPTEPKNSTDTKPIDKSANTVGNKNADANKSDNEPINTGKTANADNEPKTTDNAKPVNNSNTGTTKPKSADNGSNTADKPIEPTTKTTDSKPTANTKTNNTVPKNTDSAKPTDTNSNTADKNVTTDSDPKASTTTPTTDTKPATTGTPKPTDTEPKTTDGDPKASTTTPVPAKTTDAKPDTTDTDNTTPKTKATDTEPKTPAPAKTADTNTGNGTVTPLDPPTITDVYQPVTPLYSQDGNLPTPPSNSIDQLLNVLMAQGVFSNDTVLSGTLQDFGVTTGGATQWANAGNQQIGSGYMGQLWFTPFGQQTITDLSNNGYIWTDTTGTDYTDDDNALITFNSVTTKQSPIAGVMESTEWVKGTTWEQIPKTEIPFKTLSADSLLCQMIQSGNVILWKKNVKPNGNDMIAALPTQTFTDYLGNKWTAPLAN